ncbi:unnamed protein product [Caenorhabditis angaria]|uniref:Uncharacterized protein n=1 Tax=Caenorhabditis angaria TaxID=860376 RepID=A0A9P1N2Z0_9PELO|nr:unnamed protein product [Caenorhabditis angaria]
MFGPFCTGIFLFLAIWGAIFMGVLGGLYYNNSVGLFEDLPAEDSKLETKDWATVRVPAIEKLYQQNAYNCWVAAAVYIGFTVVLSLRACCLAKR